MDTQKFKQQLWNALNSNSELAFQIKRYSSFYARGLKCRAIEFSQRFVYPEVVFNCLKWYASNLLDKDREFVQELGGDLEPFIPGFSKQHYWRVYKDELSSIQWGKLKKEFNVIVGPYIKD
ncbi:MAG: hypothetical protein KME47_09955 [Nodosilinea sp. WJT8-NPBG4]|jgi:hypothetical protein|nr:hypothetical protein [Nodosilinea sp. WJT8-NPBG4]